MKKSLLSKKFKEGMKYPIELYDKNGNQIYYEDYNNWCVKKYDKNNNQIHSENSDGYCWEKEYDERGNQTYFKDEYGWTKREYDSRNYQIYFETSFGGIILDKRHKQIKELTMEELCKELGYEVKIIKENKKC